jgi:hypothetical protein
MASSGRGITTAVCAVLLIVASSRADTKSIEGLVINKQGNPVAGAEVRAERKDSSAAPLITKTDSRGLYAFTSIPAGKYTVTVTGEAGAHSLPRTAAVSATGNDGQPIRRFISPLPYQVRPDYRSGTPINVRRRYVWKSGETGSHIGGRWIAPAEAAAPSNNPLETLSGANVYATPSLRVNSSR